VIDRKDPWASVQSLIPAEDSLKEGHIIVNRRSPTIAIRKLVLRRDCLILLKYKTDEILKRYELKDVIQVYEHNSQKNCFVVIRRKKAGRSSIGTIKNPKNVWESNSPTECTSWVQAIWSAMRTLSSGGKDDKDINYGNPSKNFTAISEPAMRQRSQTDFSRPKHLFVYKKEKESPEKIVEEGDDDDDDGSDSNSEGYDNPSAAGVQMPSAPSERTLAFPETLPQGKNPGSVTPPNLPTQASGTCLKGRDNFRAQSWMDDDVLFAAAQKPQFSQSSSPMRGPWVGESTPSFMPSALQQPIVTALPRQELPFAPFEPMFPPQPSATQTPKLSFSQQTSLLQQQLLPQLLQQPQLFQPQQSPQQSQGSKLSALPTKSSLSSISGPSLLVFSSLSVPKKGLELVDDLGIVSVVVTNKRAAHSGPQGDEHWNNLVQELRILAQEKLSAEAQRKGANAVLGVSFSMGLHNDGATVVMACGSAVILAKGL